MQTVIRVILLAASIGIIFVLSGASDPKAESASQAAGAPKQSCDRECLRGFMTKYLDALIAHKPADLLVSGAVEAFMLTMPRGIPSG